MSDIIILPRYILIKQGALFETTSLIQKLIPGKKKILFVTDTPLLDIAANPLKKELEKEGYIIDYFLTSLASEKNVKDAQTKIKETKPDLVFGIGGGNCIDTAKLSSSREKIPFVSVPTAASHDGMGSPIASIRVDGKLTSINAQSPIAIIADIDVIQSAPEELLPAGVGDLISNYTAVADWKLALKDGKIKGNYGRYAAALSEMTAKALMEESENLSLDNPDTVRFILEGLVSSGAAMCLAGSSRPCSGAEHLFSHSLDKLSEKPGLHGTQCGLGTIMMAKLHGLDWHKVKSTLQKLNSSTTAKELKIPPEKIIKALVMAPTLRDRYTILHKNPLTYEQAETLAKETGVI